MTTVDTTDGSTVAIVYNPLAGTFHVEADMVGLTLSNTFGPTHLEPGETNPLLTGTSNPRARAVQIYVDDDSSNRIDALQVFDIRASSGSAQFNYARLLQYAALTDSGSALSAFAVYGFKSAAANVPSTGSASWQGVGTGVFSNQAGTTGYDFLGDASLSANFAGGTVTGTIANMTYLDNDMLVTPADRVTSITLNGVISGAAFSGTALTDFTVSPDISATLEGQFFGPPSAAPVEVGGAFGGMDATNLIYGGFVVGAP